MGVGGGGAARAAGARAVGAAWRRLHVWVGAGGGWGCGRVSDLPSRACVDGSRARALRLAVRVRRKRLLLLVAHGVIVTRLPLCTSARLISCHACGAVPTCDQPQVTQALGMDRHTRSRHAACTCTRICTPSPHSRHAQTAVAANNRPHAVPLAGMQSRAQRAPRAAGAATKQSRTKQPRQHAAHTRSLLRRHRGQGRPTLDMHMHAKPPAAWHAQLTQSRSSVP